ncbi:MAG: VanZ family protein [Lachnospiraceae bacterium]|nr:VanZ family protein [Lachnospiraceae bacterium]
MMKILDAWRRFARRHPLRFIAIYTVLVLCQIMLIVRFSGEDADLSGARSSRILVGIVNVVAPSSDITLDNYKTVPALFNSEKVVRKLAHFIEYGILALFIWSLLFGFRDLPRKYAYIVPVTVVALLGTFDEIHQKAVPGRYGSWFDVCVDVFAAIVTVMIAYRLTRNYRAKKSLPDPSDKD